jgi:AraC family ethanolamine operon transcriptional activator
MERVTCPHVCLDISELGCALLFLGGLPDSCYTLSYVADCPGVARAFNLGIEHGDGYLAVFPPGATLDVAEPAGSVHAILTIPEDLFHQRLEEYSPGFPLNSLTNGTAIHLDADGRRCLDQIVAEIRSLLREAGNSELADPLARENLESELIETYLKALASGFADGQPRQIPRERQCQSKVLKAREFIFDRLGEDSSVEEMANYSGLSPRGLEKLFRRTLDISPGTFQRHVRLCGAFLDLRRREKQSGAVKLVALTWGFWHMGRFAHNYKLLFGERPSETLACSPK